LRAAALKLAHNDTTKKLGVPLLSMIDAAVSDVDALKVHVEDWYNSAMDRVSGHYKYRTQLMLFGIGLVLATGLNADTINIVQQLSRSPALRESVVAAAAETAKNSGDAAKPAAGSTGGSGVQAEIQKVAGQVSELKGLGIPLGWACTESRSEHLVGASVGAGRAGIRAARYLPRVAVDRSRGFAGGAFLVRHAE
jgi:hypothetical protein